MHQHRLRVCTSIGAPTLQVVRADIASAVGQIPVTLLQEVEHDEVVVELALVQTPHVPETPSDLARMVARTSHSIEVLSAWDEVAAPPSTAVRVPDHVLDAEASMGAPAARRAIADDIPTTTWLTDQRAWQFAVPHLQGSEKVVAVSERHGYDHRFSVMDVAATRRGLLTPSATVRAAQQRPARSSSMRPLPVESRSVELTNPSAGTPRQSGQFVIEFIRDLHQTFTSIMYNCRERRDDPEVKS